LTDTPLSQIFRPQLISWFIAGVWTFTGENWEIAKYMQAAFTLGAGVILYLTLRSHKGDLFALGVVALTMLSVQVVVQSTKILTEGVSLFFLVATLYFLKSGKPNHWFLAGIMVGLTFAARYPVVLQAITLFVIESLVRKDWKLSVRAVSTAVPVILIVIFVIFMKTGTFEMALSKDTNFTYILSTFYLEHSIENWGLAFLLLPVAFIFKRTYADRYNYAFIAWFIVALLFWSANSINHQSRFVIQFTPAVYYLIMLAIEHLTGGKITFDRVTSALRKVIKNTSSAKESPYQKSKE
jgi:4-amino-4-deoxy-L-arabinose transferase-like glycosyltransferase